MAHTGAANTKEPKLRATRRSPLPNGKSSPKSPGRHNYGTKDQGNSLRFHYPEGNIERITLVRNTETSEVTLNQNASGVRRDMKRRSPASQLPLPASTDDPKR